MSNRLVEIKLPNNSTLLARVIAPESHGAEKTSGFRQFDFAAVGETLEGLAEAIRASLQNAAPDKVTVELGLELAMKNGKLSGLLVEGEGKGSLGITLEWGSDAG